MSGGLARTRKVGSWPGSALKSRYELKSVVASSGWCLVYLAWDHETSQSVVVKEFRPDALVQVDAQGQVLPLSPDTAPAFERGLRAFVKEAHILLQCEHPSLVRVLDVVEANGTAYQVMPRYRGRLFMDVRRRMGGPLGESALRELLVALLGAVESFHQRGGVHGGIHPAQILLLEDDRPLLLGPGAAGRAVAAPALHPLARPPQDGYAAPEQAHPRANLPLGPWTDCFAIAAVARFAIAGAVEPPAGLAARESLTALVRRLSEGRPGLRYDESLLNTLDAALSTDIARRPQTVAQFRERLRRVPRTAAPFSPKPPPRHVEILAPDAPPGMATALPAPQSDGWRADPADRVGIVTSRSAHTGRSRGSWWLRLALGAVALGVMAFGVWQLQDRPLDVAELMRAGPPAAGAAAAATAGSDTTPLEGLPAAPVVTPTASVALPPRGRQAPTSAPPATTPRQECGSRTQFALYRCMQLQCERTRWSQHPQCLQFAATDSVE